MLSLDPVQANHWPAPGHPSSAVSRAPPGAQHTGRGLGGGGLQSGDLSADPGRDAAAIQDLQGPGPERAPPPPNVDFSDSRRDFGRAAATVPAPPPAPQMAPVPGTGAVPVFRPEPAAAPCRLKPAHGIDAEGVAPAAAVRPPQLAESFPSTGGFRAPGPQLAAAPRRLPPAPGNEADGGARAAAVQPLRPGRADADDVGGQGPERPPAAAPLRRPQPPGSSRATAADARPAVGGKGAVIPPQRSKPGTNYKCSACLNV